MIKATTGQRSTLADQHRRKQKVPIIKPSLLESCVAAAVMASARCGLVVCYASAFEWPSGYMTVPFDLHLLLSIAVATWSVALVLWRYCPQSGSGTRRGATAGFFVGLICHPTTWFIYCLISYFQMSPPIEQPFRLHEAILGSLLYGFLSLLFFGVFTVVTLTFTGAILGRICSMDGTSDEAGDASDNRAC